MMARMLTQVPLPLLPGGAAEIAPGVGMVTGPDGSGVMWVHGLATFAWDAGDEAGRRLAAVQLRQLRAATQAQVAEAFGVIPVSVWRWERALAAGGVAGLVPDRKGPRRASKLTPGVVARIRELDGQGLGKAGIAAAAGVSESSVRNVLGPASAGGGDGPGAGAGPAADPAAAGEETAGGQQDAVPVLPDPVGRDAERVLARFGLLGEGAAPVFTPGARYPLAGLLLALPALEGTGLLACARATYGRVRNGFYGLEVMLVVLVFLALLREPRAEGATLVYNANNANGNPSISTQTITIPSPVQTSMPLMINGGMHSFISINQTMGASQGLGITTDQPITIQIVTSYVNYFKTVYNPPSAIEKVNVETQNLGSQGSRDYLVLDGSDSTSTNSTIESWKWDI